MARSPSVLPQTFKHHFDALVPMVLAEWPQLIEENLLATEGDLDLAVTYISGETDRTQTLIRRQLNELATLVEAQPSPSTAEAEPPSQTAAPNEAANGAPAASLGADGALGVDKSSIDTLLDDLESRTETLIQELKSEMLPELERRARGNLGQSLLIALGIGFVLGLILGGKRD